MTDLFSSPDHTLDALVAKETDGLPYRYLIRKGG